MNRILLNHAYRTIRHYHSTTTFKPHVPITTLQTITQPHFRFFSSDTEPPNPETNLTESSSSSSKKQEKPEIDDVSNKDFKALINKYFKDNDLEVIPEIMVAILKRILSGKHEETDEELMEELRIRPLEDAVDEDIESDFEEAFSTDEEIDDLYDTRKIVEKRMTRDSDGDEDETFNMDDEKFEELVEDAVEDGDLDDTGECEDILEDMMCWDKLLPDEVKQKVEAKFNELGDMCERGELEPEAAYELFKEFEDEIVFEYQKIMEAEQPPMEDVTGTQGKMKMESDDPPGEGPILRWQSRVIFAPGGDAWHPKNRKVKLSVTVKELGLSKHARRRLRELVGKRYESGKDELTLTSERFEHREENRKDCLRTLLALIEEAIKADKLVEDTRTSHIKTRLKSNPVFMERLQAKKAKQSAVLA